MNAHGILSPPEYYARLNAYMRDFGLPCAIEDFQRWAEHAPRLLAVLGEAQGRSALDCACGWGTQTVPLAKLGWQVTAGDISTESLACARRYAEEAGVAVDFRICDARQLDRLFDRQFDCVLSCYGLYEITDDEGLAQAFRGMHNALKPGGRCYLELRDMDFLMTEPRARYIFRGEKRVPHGRMLCLLDWTYESETHVVARDVFIREDERFLPDDHRRWVSESLGLRKRVLRRADIMRFCHAAGFGEVIFLPQTEPGQPLQVLATRPAATV